MSETIEAPAEAAPKKAAAQPKPCACVAYVAKLADGTELTTGCTAQTPRNFAPGHDAKLKSLLIKAAIAGVDVTRSNGDGVTELSPLHAAEDFGFRAQVEKGVDTQARKDAVKSAKKAERQAAADKRAADAAAKKAEREAAAAQRKADREEAKAQREADRKASQEATAAASDEAN